ncbi:MAG TPA: hypothetical protein VJ875_11545 [Pyrinomonadaceae bacterium]|nr:hypothetical protein [Pyrinomonadaceae bacterium]
MSEEHNTETDESGLLLSVDPMPEHSLDFTAVVDDNNNVQADTDTEDTVGDADATDETDTDTVDDADGTD